jgi:hypothetical protein
MPVVLISTVSRRAPQDQPSGHLYAYDSQTHKVLIQTEIPEPAYREFNPNPRGGTRGVKGISFNGEILAIANGNSVFCYSQDWVPRDVLYHPSASLIHEILLDHEAVWVTSAENDLLCLIAPGNQLVKYYDTRQIAQALGTRRIPRPVIKKSDIDAGVVNYRDPRTHESAFTDAVHINSIDRTRDGSLLVSLGFLKSSRYQWEIRLKEKMVRSRTWQYIEQANQFLQSIVKPGAADSLSLMIQPDSGRSMIIRLKPDGTFCKVLTIRGVTNPSHTVKQLADGSGIYLDTSRGEILRFDIETGAIRQKKKIGARFLRGALEMADGTLLVGDHSEILEINARDFHVISRTAITKNTQEAILCIHPLPPGFALPPSSLREIHQAYPQFKQI